MPPTLPDSSLTTCHLPLATPFSGVPKSAEALVLAELLAGKYPGHRPQTIIHIATSDRQLEQTAGALAFFAPDVEALRFPAWDCLPYDRVSPQAAIMAARMHVLNSLSREAGEGRGEGKIIILTTANAAVQKLPPKNIMRQVSVTLTVGQSCKQNALAAALVAQGYRRVGKAMEPGEFALRGGIVDIVPPSMSEGVRIDLFGDDIESIKRFDPLTQLSQGTQNSVALYPVSEVLLNNETSERFRERYREMFGAVTKDDPLYEAVSQHHAYPGIEHWLPLFYERTDTLFDYCEGALVTFDSEAQTAIDERRETIRDYFEARTQALSMGSKKNSFASGAAYHPLPPGQFFLMESLPAENAIAFSPFTSPVRGEVEARSAEGGGNSIPANRLTPTRLAALGDLPPNGGGEYRPVIRFTQGQADHTPFDQLKERAASARPKSTLLACVSEGSRQRLQTLLMERGFHVITVERWQDIKNVRGKSIGLAVLPLESGFETDAAVILSEQDVLGERIIRAVSKKRKSDTFLLEAANFAEGELVVHKEHGIGRFEGLITLTVQNAAHDCLKLVYEGGDKLFLPVENIELVTRFGLEEENVKLDKLGGVSWQSRKAKLKDRIKLAAEALLKTAAERLVKTAAAIETPSAYDEFCARFPFAETEDQARAISEVLEDLHKGRPMDRLICGDVGFGKTEVALRAAFAVANAARDGVMEMWSDGVKTDSTPSPHHSITPSRHQVALVCPTTLLARQHYLNFKTRFAGFPVEVRQLSRMVPARAQEETREGIKAGTVDIVIGTHALLSKNVEFKNLALLIVDEEQHFGVAQKEKLKSLKSDVHVLTLSATPIPRTLQMALTGVRDLSLITTPPIDRLAVRSFVMPFDPVVIREALLREQHRGGKSFIVTPRIKDIPELKLKIAELMPELKIAVAHGQMPPAELDDIMNDFYDGKFDALLSTSIIESGLDIAAANTMIIHNAHMFGLSQLYQLRGRVGRGKTRAYAYFVLPHHRSLSKNATRRLEVMQTLDTLGAGFTLASHDMDIRGFGNLVGEEQSGHIKEVGIELYQQMLEEAVQILRRAGGESAGSHAARDPAQSLRDSQDYSPQINLGISVLIPETYVDDLQLRLGLYRRAASLSTEADIDAFAAELVDRFGAMPEETAHLISTLGLKILCKKAHLERIDVGPKGAVLSFRENKFPNPDALLNYIGKNTRSLKARPDQKLIFTHDWKNAADTIATIKKLVGEIGSLA